MIHKQAGNTLVGHFQTFDQEDSLIIPETVRVSIVKPDGSEDVLTYLGSDSGDSRLTYDPANSRFEFSYAIPRTGPFGVWYLNPSWQVTVDGSLIECTLDEPVPMKVTPNISKNQDHS